VAQLIDTSVFIALERRQINLDLLTRSFPAERIVLAAITASELFVAVRHADAEERRRRRQTFAERILSTLSVIPFDLPAARTYARLIVDLRKSGETVGTHDLQIAATALSGGFEVVTHNVRDLGRSACQSSPRVHPRPEYQRDVSSSPSLTSAS